MKVYSNEIVFRGHPDKVCDQISDAILDECLRQDKNSRCGIETVGGKGKIFITGEVSTNAHIDVEKIAKSVLADVGYSTDYLIINNLGVQSVDIALGFRRIQPVGYFTVRINDAIPTGTTTTLPVTLTMNGTTRSLTLFDGTPVTVAELIGGTGTFLVFNNRFDGILQLMSRTTV